MAELQLVVGILTIAVLACAPLSELVETAAKAMERFAGLLKKLTATLASIAIIAVLFSPLAFGSQASEGGNNFLAWLSRLIGTLKAIVR